MSTWRVRYEGSPTIVEAPSAQAVLVGLGEGEWASTDEVRGPGDRDWTPIMDHPQFVDAVAEMEKPPPKKHEDLHLDMNPLIDVALVLLIFFILTTSYASLRRSIDVAAPAERQGGEPTKPNEDPEKDKSFKVEAWMADDRPRVKVDEKIVEIEDVEREIKAFVASTGRRDMILEVEGKIPWGVEARIHDAAKGADVRNIFRKARKPGG